MEKQFEIKIMGNGTLEDIYTSIYDLQKTISEYLINGFGNDLTKRFEDPILYSEITVMEE